MEALLPRCDQTTANASWRSIRLLFCQGTLYVELGYSSLFAYCTKGVLKYSEPSANRRISSARLISRFPELYAMLLRKEVTLTTLSLVSGIISEENKTEVIQGIKGKSRREVEGFISLYRPRPKIRESVKPVTLTVRAESVGSPLFESQSEKMESDPHQLVPTTFAREGDLGSEPERRYELRFSVSEETMQKFREAQKLLSGKYPRGMKLEDVLDEALEVFLDKKSPLRRQERREKREKRKKINSVGAAKARSRHIPQEIRDQVFKRDGGKCTYIGSDGVRCCSTWDVEVHHRQPFARNGSHSLDNLTLLCRRHNSYEAKQEYCAY